MLSLQWPVLRESVSFIAVFPTSYNANPLTYRILQFSMGIIMLFYGPCCLN